MWARRSCARARSWACCCSRRWAWCWVASSRACASGWRATRSATAGAACARWCASGWAPPRTHRDAGRRSAFYIEIDRVVREVLAARLGRAVTGLRRDELRDLLLARGMPADEAATSARRAGELRPGALRARRGRGRRVARADERRARARGRADRAPSTRRRCARRRCREARGRDGALALAARCWRWRCCRPAPRAPIASTKRGAAATTPTCTATTRGAVAAYEELDRQGLVSADLYFNLGDAYYRQGDLGRAIWSFERAAALDPDDEDVRYNLTQARKLADRARARQDRGRGPRAVLDPRGGGLAPVDGDLAVHWCSTWHSSRLLARALAAPARATQPPALLGAQRRSWPSGRCSPARCSRAAPTSSASRSAWCCPTRWPSRKAPT